MRNDLTDITVILDRSGSMSSCKDDAQGGLNALVDEQKKQPGEALFTLIQFDTEYEVVHKGVPIQDVPPCSLMPRGSTALLDAVGKGIVETGERLAAMQESQRPALVVFVIITDGQENSSREFKKDAIKSMIRHQTDVYKWKFLFLGADQDAFAEAGGMGIDPAMAAKYSKAKTSGAFRVHAKKLSRARAETMSGGEADMAYTQDERDELA